MVNRFTSIFYQSETERFRRDTFACTHEIRISQTLLPTWIELRSTQSTRTIVGRRARTFFCRLNSVLQNALRIDSRSINNVKIPDCRVQERRFANPSRSSSPSIWRSRDGIPPSGDVPRGYTRYRALFNGEGGLAPAYLRTSLPNPLSNAARAHVFSRCRAVFKILADFS